MINKKIQLLLVLIFLCTATYAQKKLKLVILHTNDTHSQIEPTGVSTLKTADMGGYARRMGMITKIRSEEKNVLLLDAGDFWQGTPYFNFFNGRLEIDAFNRMKYDAVTIGNHEFDNGMDSLAKMLKMAEFPIVSSNYDVKNTPLNGLIQPYLVLKRFGLQIGIMALNVQPKSLIIESNYRGLLYNEPIAVANQMADFLKTNKKCDVVICLSHLGSDANAKAINDFQVARETRNIDVILGGHSHTLLENAKQTNLDGKQVVIAQMGKSGLYLGKVEFVLER